MIAQPGDKIIVTDRNLGWVCGTMCLVVSRSIEANLVGYVSDYIQVVEYGGNNNNSDFCLRHDCYEVLEDSTKAAVGDKVIVTYKHWENVYLKTFVVEEVREDRVLVVAGICIDVDKCKILKRDQCIPMQSCLECHGTGKIQLFTSTVRCKCNV